MPDLVESLLLKGKSDDSLAKATLNWNIEKVTACAVARWLQGQHC
jgi:hypothetical protein